MNKILFQLYIEPEQYNYIKNKSEETGRSRAAITREIIDKFREEEKESSQ